MRDSLTVADSDTDSLSGVEHRVVEFARAFRAAARAVAFYPAAHPAVEIALQPLVAAVNDATARGPLCFTVLPRTMLVDGAAVQSSDSAVTDLAGRLHRHGIGAMRLNGRATPGTWQRFLTLIARPADQRARVGRRAEAVGKGWTRGSGDPRDRLR